MKYIQLLAVLILVTFASPSWSYGSGSSQKACKKPKFSQFTPAHLAEVNAGAEFSFHASALTNPKSIVVSVKKQIVEVLITEKNNAYKVTGKLPLTLQNEYARINIKASGTNNCKASDGWLLKTQE